MIRWGIYHYTCIYCWKHHCSSICLGAPSTNWTTPKPNYTSGTVQTTTGFPFFQSKCVGEVGKRPFCLCVCITLVEHVVTHFTLNIVSPCTNSTVIALCTIWSFCEIITMVKVYKNTARKIDGYECHSIFYCSCHKISTHV